MLKMIAQFIISGSVVVLASYISPKFGQKWAGLIVAAPLLTLLTFIFLSLDSRNNNLRDYLASALIFMIPAAIFIACLLLFSNRLHFVLNVMAGFCIFSLAVLCIYKLKLV
jgi:uncharacterized membrane protein (GlpM family)